MKATVKHNHYFGVIALLFFGAQASAQVAPSPSFNCQKAVSTVEKAICGDEALARLDSRLGKAWKAVITAFNDDNMKAQMRQEQADWVASRNKCQTDVDCIVVSYRQRLDALGFGQQTHSLAGQYENKAIGTVTVYPGKDNVFLVAIQTAESSQGTWTCEVYGKAVGKQNSLAITVGSNQFFAVISDAGLLTIEANDEVFAVGQSNCGLNGGFADSYRRVAVE